MGEFRRITRIGLLCLAAVAALSACVDNPQSGAVQEAAAAPLMSDPAAAPAPTPTAAPAPTITSNPAPVCYVFLGPSVLCAGIAPLVPVAHTFHTRAAASESDPKDPFAHWNDLEPQPWWRDSEPYSCAAEENIASPWAGAGLVDLGGGDPLSLIRHYGNDAYLRYGFMGFEGCTPMNKYPDRTHLDPPADPTYYSVGERELSVDIARVPPDAKGWFMDDGSRVEMSMEDAVDLLNTHVAAYYSKVSEGKLQFVFRAGHDFSVGRDGAPSDAEDQLLAAVTDCWDANPGCRDFGQPGGLDRILFNDVAVHAGGSAYNGFASLGLVSLRDADMETIVHEIGHGWMWWPHSFTELPWEPYPGDEIEQPNPYSNRLDMMSSLVGIPVYGWHSDMPPPLAINRYSAGWISPEKVALHLAENATYTLGKPYHDGHQFLVIHSGRPHAFTTLEVLAERPPAYVTEFSDVYDPSAEGERRPFRYDGVLVSRYDQTTGTGVNARFGPALHDPRNPDSGQDVGWGRDDYSLIGDGESRDVGGGVTVAASRNEDGSYDVAVSGGMVAEFGQWCNPIWFAQPTEYDAGCLMDDMFNSGLPSR